ncbi:hypothetical protein [Enterobacter roggenkampii]|uniref:glycine-rich domain-containing protein n=1 Tax=Enterobacter roggenkampii TaxID=1812935 RepID=UPI0039C30152
MNRSDAPSKKSVPFGINGPREAILDTTPAGNNQASYDSGFPPITMILKSAGGLPPKGEDFNQILYELALNARWNQAGAGYQFDSTFSTGISGYPIGAIVQNSTGDGTWINTTDGNTNNPEVATATPLTGWIPLDSNGFTTKSGLTNANITLTTLEASRERIILSGTLTANINLIVPAWRKKWTVVNNCTGAFSVTIKTTSGTGIAVPAGLTAYVIGDGTNVTSDSSLLGFSGRLINIQTFTSGSGTYTPTPGMKYALVYVIGAGGGSGSAPATSSTQTSASPGGASGSWAFVKLLASDIGASQTYVVGQGGAAGIGGAGGNGGPSSFGSLISAPGGNGSPAGVAISTTASALIPGGAPGGVPTISSGTVLESSNGNPGGKSIFITANTLAGDGGVSPKGGGGQGLGATAAATSGSGKGAGASGAGNGTSSATSKNGAAGTDGCIWIWEYA